MNWRWLEEKCFFFFVCYIECCSFDECVKIKEIYEDLVRCMEFRLVCCSFFFRGMRLDVLDNKLCVCFIVCDIFCVLRFKKCGYCSHLIFVLVLEGVIIFIEKKRKEKIAFIVNVTNIHKKNSKLTSNNLKRFSLSKKNLFLKYILDGLVWYYFMKLISSSW